MEDAERHRYESWLVDVVGVANIMGVHEAAAVAVSEYERYIVESMPHRQYMPEENQPFCWDAGWFQLNRHYRFKFDVSKRNAARKVLAGLIFKEALRHGILVGSY